MAKLTEIEATYRVVTPLFCAGADQRRAEIRLPSFKGALRFWWRALAWSRLEGDLKKIQQEEAKLFGSAGPKGGQSRVLMRIAPCNQAAQLPGYNLSVGPGARYLGYGVFEKGHRTRCCLQPQFEFKVRMRGRDLNSMQLNWLEDTLIALGVSGGMGARSRKGYGSLALQSLIVDGMNKWSAPQSSAELGVRIRDTLFCSGPGGLPHYTAISNGARYLLIERGAGTRQGRQKNRRRPRQASQGHRQTPMGLLDWIGSELKDAIKAVNGRQRIAFGLPRAGASISGVERRASPLFIHIHKCGDTPVAVLSFLPARFLPQGKSGISVGGNRISQLSEEQLYKPIDEFLDRLLDQNKRKEPFTNVREVSL